MASIYPDNYKLLNDYQTKFLNVVVTFEGSPITFSLVKTYKAIRYGDPIHYGDENLIYGGLMEIENNYPYLSSNSNLTLNQKIEPEQGRGSSQTISLEFNDVDGFVTKFVSPGQYFNELMGSKMVKVYVGYQNSSFKEDYYCVFRGYVTSIQVVATRVMMQLSDGNFKRKQQCFFMGKTNLSSSIDSTQTTIPVLKTDNFIDHVLGPGGTYDSSLKTYLKIDDEYLQYGPGAIGSNSFTVTRAMRGTIGQPHDVGADVSNEIVLEGNIIDLSLKIMLSGWGSPWISDIPIKAFNVSSDPILGNVNSLIVLRDGVNAVDDFGLAVGDFITISSSGLNDGAFSVAGFANINNYPNQGIYVFENTNLQATTSGVMSIRSKYDTLPAQCGVRLKPIDVDVAQWQNAKKLYAFQSDNIFSNLIKGPTSAKEYVEKEYLLPVGAYSITRFGRLSVSFTKPPLAKTDLVVLDHNNILDPKSISVQRALNTRRFFNEIQYYYDSDNDGTERNVLKRLDTVSITNTEVSSVLPIHSKGLRTELGAESLIKRRGDYLLRRYKDAAVEISLKINWTAASMLQVSDTVAIYDDGNLQIANLATGERDLGAALYEVIDWSLDMKSGSGSVKVLSSLGYELTDRFASIAPSSKILADSTTSLITIEESFGGLFKSQEWKKWEPIVGDKIKIHSPDFSFSEEVLLVGFDSVHKNKLIISPPLSVAPTSGWIVDCATYPISSKTDNQKSKLLFVFLDPTLSVVSGLSNKVFDVSPSDADKIGVGLPLKIRSSDWTQVSSESIVESIVGQTITLKTSLEFIPTAGMKIELVGFKDNNGPYRLL